jgi:nucleoid DNA-binding protein
MSNPSNSFSVIVDLVRSHLGCDDREARDLLEAIGDAIAREAVVRANTVVWPRLGVFRAKSQKARTVDLRGLKAGGHVPESSPDEAHLEPMKKLRFSPSRKHGLWRGSKP